MDISGSYTLHAPREQVWNALLDPDTLKRTVPGCESLEQTGDNEYAVRLNVGVAGVKGTYDGALKVLEVKQPDSYRMVVDGTGARGILHGDGVLRLDAQDAGTTVVRYSGQAQLGGTIASIGMRVAGGAANMLIKQYFARLARQLPTSAMPATSETAVAGSTPAEVTPAEATPVIASAESQMPPFTVSPASPPPAPTEDRATPATPATPATAVGPTDGSIASEQQRSRLIGTIVVAIIIVLLIVWLIVSR
ncbi:MAG TPA: carbon monoxide dehydrogenase subunit G [Ktedonobacterales bacterium]|nr:carbon monoxide dehydrogenase subunit G [Ktedonobacterales bacterium]